MNDHIAGEDLAAYVDRVLENGKKAELESHFSHCRECLEALAEIVDIRNSRVKIPGEFLRQVLGEKQAARKPVLPLRLVFEIAAAFLVVVFIGYFFLGNHRFWQAESTQKEKAAAPASEPVSQLPPEVDQTIPALAGRVESVEAAKAKKSLVANKVMISPTPAKTLGKKTEQAAAFKDRKSIPVDMNEMREQEQKLEKAAARPIQAEADKMGDAQLVRSRSTEMTATGGTVQPVLAAKVQAAQPAGKGMAAPAPQSGFRIEGAAVWADLLDPELLDSWSWFKKGMILELELDGAGVVTAVIPVGPWQRSIVVRAEKAARQLTFSISAKKSRRVRISVSASSPN